MTQDKAPEWATKAAGEVLDMFVATDAVNVETVALALSQAYERGQESRFAYPAFEDWYLEAEGFSLRAERFQGDVAWLKAAFEAGRSLPIEQEAGE
jgi:hypothetical protein